MSGKVLIHSGLIFFHLKHRDGVVELCLLGNTDGKGIWREIKGKTYCKDILGLRHIFRLSRRELKWSLHLFKLWVFNCYERDNQVGPIWWQQLLWVRNRHGSEVSKACSYSQKLGQQRVMDKRRAHVDRDLPWTTGYWWILGDWESLSSDINPLVSPLVSIG